jgi:hypothetical protein
MSYRGYGCSAWAVNWDFIKSLVPKEAEEYEKACKKEYPETDFPMDNAAYDFDIDDGPEELIPPLVEVYNAFEKATNGLILQVGWISSDADSDIYDGVWYVGGVEQLTPAGEKYKDHLEYLRWSEYG